jgi:hypothetical protein
MKLLPIVSSRPKTCAAALGCASFLASLAFFAGDRLYTGANAATASAETPIAAIPVAATSGLPLGASGAICVSPTFLQLAQTTEVSPMVRQASPDPAAAFDSAEPPLWSNLGTITYKISTANPEAQKYFDQGLRLAYGFNHAEARRAFRKAQKLDPECAMCFWGEALVLGPHVNMGMMDDAVAPAWAALTKAKALAPRAAPNEQALIAALSHRYTEAPVKDRAPLDKAYAGALGRAAKQFPDDS